MPRRVANRPDPEPREQHPGTRRTAFWCFPSGGMVPNHQKCDDLWDDYGYYCICPCHGGTASD